MNHIIGKYLPKIYIKKQSIKYIDLHENISILILIFLFNIICLKHPVRKIWVMTYRESSVSGDIMD